MEHHGKGVACSCLKLKMAEEVNEFENIFSSPLHNEVHVLAVDDTLLDRKLVEGWFNIISCKVTVVDSGKKALEYLGLDEEGNTMGVHGVNVDLIISDYCMPEMTGYELLKKIKGSARFRDIPFVIMSSENVEERMASLFLNTTCLEEGAKEFIAKPLKLEDVERLKRYTFGEVKGTAKRKMQETSHEFVLSDESLSSPPTISSPSSPTTVFSTPSSNATPLGSPTSVESPTRRHKVKGSDNSSSLR